MKNLDIFKTQVKECSQLILAALKDNDETKVNDAFEKLIGSVSESVRADFEAVQTSNDSKILSDRGIRQLTSAENKYWQAFIKANKEADVKQAISNIDVAFPETVFEDIYKEMTDEHPLLKLINFQNVKTVTKWIMDDSSVDKAVWGELTEEVQKEISGAIKLVEMTQCKLSAFAIVPLDILDLGPAFVDAFIRRLLTNALYSGFEYGILNGKGVQGEPIGLVRDIHAGVTVSTTDGYPKKTAVEVTDLSPKTFGNLLSVLCKSEKGSYRTIDRIAFVVNPVDYYSKIMPSTTIQSADGTYKNNIVPFPTDFVQSAELEEGEAVVFLPQEYFFGIGTAANGAIEFSDEFKFLEDKRAYKIKAHANGRAYDNTVALLLDISNLDEFYHKVKVIGQVTETASQNNSEPQGNDEKPEG